MASKVLTLYVDDLTGTEIPEGQGGPVTFALDGHEYEIDLSTENADKMRDALNKYVGAARRLTRHTSSRRSSSGGGRSESDRERARTIREWAVEHGHMKPESRGRIPHAIVEMYESRNSGTQTTIPSPAKATDAELLTNANHPENVAARVEAAKEAAKGQRNASEPKKAAAATKGGEKEKADA